MTRCLSSAAVSVLETTVWPAGRGRGRQGGGVFHTPSAEGGVLGAAAPLAPTLTERWLSPVPTVAAAMLN